MRYLFLSNTVKIFALTFNETLMLFHQIYQIDRDVIKSDLKNIAF